jgi:hypothetical protein
MQYAGCRHALALGALLAGKETQQLTKQFALHAACSGRKTLPIERMLGLAVIRSIENGR